MQDECMTNVKLTKLYGNEAKTTLLLTGALCAVGRDGKNLCSGH